jgi:S-adenosyl-L-methionine hydrolase (adenosine-forming)
MAAIITLLSDFGTADGYVAEMKGVVLGRTPDATLVDVTHEIEAQDVEAARLVLERYWRRFPPGTVHMVVVDPGVGSSRAAIAVSAEYRFLVGPDNGVLSPALLSSDAAVVTLPIPAGASPTFHGRDVFAPAAAALAAGVPLERLGSRYACPIVRRTPEPTVLTDGAISGEILTIDKFGNAITNIAGPRPGHTVWVGALGLSLHVTYSEVPKGEPIALTGSSGCIEIAVREGSAARRLGLTRGSAVILRPDDHATAARAGDRTDPVARGIGS